MVDNNQKNSIRELKSSLNCPIGYKFLVFLSMTYMSIMIYNAVLTNRYIGTNEFFVLGGTLTSPFVFIMDDIIAEIYGYKITQSVILSGFFAQTLFTLICWLATTSTYPSFFKEHTSYAYVLGSSLLRIDVSGFAAYIIANLINSYIITRWKVLLKGRIFWLRSIGSSAFSEILYSFLAIILMEVNSIPFHQVIKVIIISFSIKLTYSIIFAFPATILVNFIKRATGIDVYDLPKNFTPFKFKREELAL